MADLKISQLNELTTADSNDKFPIVDTSATETKYIQASSLGLDSYVLTLSHANFSASDSTIYYFGGAYNAAPTNAGSTYYRLYIPKTGTITQVTMTMCNGGSFATTEDSTMALRLNDTTDYTITSVLKHNANGGYYTLPGQSIAVSAGDYIVGKWTTPAWVTNPTNVIHNITLFIKA